MFKIVFFFFSVAFISKSTILCSTWFFLLVSRTVIWSHGKYLLKDLWKLILIAAVALNKKMAVFTLTGVTGV